MSVYTISKAESELEQLISETDRSHIPILITGQYSNAVLIAEHDWNAIQETLYLLSVPGMRDSIREGMKTPIDKCEQELDW